MRLVVTADSAEKAKSELQSRIAEYRTGFFEWKVFREELLFDGTESVLAFGETEEEAIARTRIWTIPLEAKAVDTKTQPPGESRTEIVEAFDEESAKIQLREKFGGDLLVDSLSVQTEGRKGFLGIGKTRNVYALSVRSPASASVAYKFARFSAYLFDTSSARCEVCKIEIIKKDMQKAMNGSEEEYIPRLCDGCGNWVCWWCAIHLLAPGAYPTDHFEKIRNNLTVLERQVFHTGCGGKIISFKTLIATAKPVKRQPVCSACGKAVPEQERQPDKLGHITEQLFPESPLAKYGITVGQAMKCNGCGEWICAKCAEESALKAGVGALQHLNCGGMFETNKP